MLTAPEMNQKLKDFSESSDRLDDLYYELIGTEAQFAQLWKCVKIFLVMSHGNATVESGFSINADLLIENLTEKSIVAQRMVYDAVKHAGGTLNVEINKEMLKECQNSRRAYGSNLELQKQQNKDEDKKKLEQKQARLQIIELESKKRKMEEEKEALDSKIKKLSKVAKNN